MVRAAAALMLLTAACNARPERPASSPPSPVETAVLTKQTTSIPGVDEGVIERYVAAERDILELSKRFAAESLDAGERAARPRPKKGAARSPEPPDRRKQFDDQVEAIKSRSGVDRPTWQTLDRLFETVLTARMAWRREGGDAAIQKLERDIQAQLAAMPADQRTKAAPELAKLADGLKGLRDGADARRVWGDAAVDLVIRHGAEVEALREQLFDLAQRR